MGPEPALLDRVPLTARQVRYVGGAAAEFEAAVLARNPQCGFATQGQPADVVALEDLEAIDADPELLADLEPGGCLVAVVRPESGGRAVLDRLALAGLTVQRLQRLDSAAAAFDDRAENLVDAWPDDPAPPLLVVARKPPIPPALHLSLVAFAPRLMDIRTRLPARALRADPDLVVTYQTPPFNPPTLSPETPKVQVLQRPAAGDAAAWRRGVAWSVAHRWIVVLEFDDHPELIARLAGQPVTEALWSRFAGVHAVQTSTPALAEAFGRHNPEVKVFPNAVFDLAPFRPERPQRVFYGAVQRGGFAVEVARSLGPAADEFADAEFVVVGDRAVFEALPTARKRFHDYLPYEAYLREMAACSVSLSPIAAAPLLDTKSDAKFLDAASQGALTLASPTIYGAAIRHGETGLIAQRLEDWAPLLGAALRDEPARRRMARAAWEHVRDHRMFAHQAARRRDWYRDLWTRRADLDAALLARLPGL